LAPISIDAFPVDDDIAGLIAGATKGGTPATIKQ
jgi:hypothetical protein